MNPTQNGWDFLFLLIPKNSLPLTKDALATRIRSLPLFADTRCALRTIRCKGRFKIWRVSSQHNGVHAIYSSLKNQGNFYCSFPLAWKSSAASGQVLRLLHPVKSMGYISLFLLSHKRSAEFSGLFLNPFHMISRGVLSFAYRRPLLLDEIYKYRRYIPSFRLAVCYPTTSSCPHRKLLGFFLILPPVS